MRAICVHICITCIILYSPKVNAIKILVQVRWDLTLVVAMNAHLDRDRCWSMIRGSIVAKSVNTP